MGSWRLCAHVVLKMIRKYLQIGRPWETWGRSEPEERRARRTRFCLSNLTNAGFCFFLRTVFSLCHVSVLTSWVKSKSSRFVNFCTIKTRRRLDVVFDISDLWWRISWIHCLFLLISLIGRCCASRSLVQVYCSLKSHWLFCSSHAASTGKFRNFQVSCCSSMSRYFSWWILGSFSKCVKGRNWK